MGDFINTILLQIDSIGFLNRMGLMMVVFSTMFFASAIICLKKAWQHKDLIVKFFWRSIIFFAIGFFAINNPIIFLLSIIAFLLFGIFKALIKRINEEDFMERVYNDYREGE